MVGVLAQGIFVSSSLAPSSIQTSLHLMFMPALDVIREERWGLERGVPMHAPSDPSN